MGIQGFLLKTLQQTNLGIILCIFLLQQNFAKGDPTAQRYTIRTATNLITELVI
jgi:hypothetical protein